MTTLAISREEVRSLHADLADDVAGREARLGAELPVDSTADVAARLREVVGKWERGRKSVRTVPACNAYARVCDEPVPESVKRTLTALDATINVLDDIIDTRDLRTQEKIALTVNAAFSGVAMVGSCPPAYRADVEDALLEYYTSVFQIPLVERELFEHMEAADATSQKLAAAEALYAYRSCDIDAFARIPAIVMDVGEETERRMLEDLRAYRCRRLLYKDIGDVERDLVDGDVTPVIHFLGASASTDAVVDSIERLHDRFTYSTVGRRQYGDVLELLEEPPEDLHAAVREARQNVLEMTP
ncbi:hypothetical protein [Halogeometricum limi]|uniref:Uncharacterized protein n=1 Tax=Halogeometricum limi TaxID=555875 RepID=A0A1I6I327_9EURY|nr:hypothetical protein [Halogeometricum limi]SFR61113.1 hypothetical protein SAMN04488124_2755 [Halogeometricum limi]